VWNEFLKHERGNQLITIAHNPSLGPILEKTFGYESQNMVVKNKSKLVGVLPMVKVGKKLVSMPHFSYGGPVIDSKETIELDFETIFKRKKFEIRSLKNWTEHFYDKKITSIVELKPSLEEQFNALKPGKRRKIRKAKKLNFEFVQGGIELLDDFYRLFAKKMLQKGSPPLGKVFFKNLLTDYKHGEALISAIYDGQKVTASGFTLSYMGFTEICWISTNPKYDKVNVNTLLYWYIMRDTIKKNNIYFSMGRSSVDSSNLLYKRRWSPIELQLYYNYSEPVGKSIKEFTFLTKIWRLLPLSVSVYLGRIISKYIY
jgi:hypothetical protein